MTYRIVYASPYSRWRYLGLYGGSLGPACALPVIQSDGEHLRDAYVWPDEEYWRAYMVTGMTNQRDPFFHRGGEIALTAYGRHL